MAINFFKHLKALYNVDLDNSSESHRAILGTLKLFLDKLDDDTRLMLEQLCISTAKGGWLEKWGEWFGVNRNVNESDESLRTRIINSMLIPKNTVSALATHSRDFFNSKTGEDRYTESDITVDEPFRYINLMSQRGRMSVDLRMPDDDYYRWNVIDIVIPESAENDYKKLIHSIKSAGIRVYYTLRTADLQKVVTEFGEATGCWAYNQINKNVAMYGVISGYRPSKGFGAISGGQNVWHDLMFGVPGGDIFLKFKAFNWTSPTLDFDSLANLFGTEALEDLFDFNWDELSSQQAIMIEGVTT